jgi:hypothetical protein
MFPRLFQFFYRIRSVIHRQAQTSLYLCYISSMYLETIFSFYVFLYLFVCNSLFRLVRFGSLYDIIQRYFSLTLTKLNFYVDMSVWLFVGKQYYRLNMYRISKLSTVQFCVSFHSLYNTVKSRLFQQLSFYCFLHLTVIYFYRWQNGDIATNIQKLATPSRKRWGY